MSNSSLPERHRLLVDQMFKVDLAEALRADGHDVVRVAEIGQARAEDADILASAISRDRILLTLDEDFGDWAILPLRIHPGVIRVKVHPPTTAKVHSLVAPFLEAHPPSRFANHLAILAPGRVKWIPTGDLTGP
ncbi:MAG: DUF5615 family PIN-like protein [Candidatus Riflebacteria bacterium]|nr:DUF5615 family PIN-like protein [Candidatus Riflebacteria bacterium]